MSNTFNTHPPVGTLGYDAAIDRPDRSKLLVCRTEKHPTRLAAVNACIDRIQDENVRVKPSNTITTHEWTATDDGWQVEMMRILSGAERVTVQQAYMKWPGFSTPAEPALA